MREFTRDGDAYVAGLVDGERLAIVDLICATVSTIQNGDPQTSEVAGRLLPPASDDIEVAEKYRQLAEPDLRRGKADRLVKLAGLVTGDSPVRHEDAEGDERPSDEEVDVIVPLEDAADVAAAFTDLRLLLAYLIEIPADPPRHTGADAIDESGEPRRITSVDEMLQVLSTIVGYLQDSLVEAMMTTLDEEQR